MIRSLTQMPFKMLLLLLLGAVWHIGTAWIAGAVFRLDLAFFLVVVALASVIGTKVSEWSIPAAVIETDVWSLLGVSASQDVILSLLVLFISSIGFYWVVRPCYGMSGYLAAVAVSYGVAYASGYTSKIAH